ncbi:hypothetical protein BRADI_2g38010v3 [Brachypodium distachyon]|uniref:Uncharacterized protein n=1 Tax=Brachypodium distachyon TaxID=15368 RepID=I1HMK2_BRADI|nr:hypothetical protein BRADI_2g38010v3 [Brachypodium distachyon]
MAAGRKEDDRLSGLPDDLLRRILHFAPAREGASTAALSSRCKDHWLSSGAVNLELRVPESEDDNPRCVRSRDDPRFYARRDAMVAAAHRALDRAADGGAAPVTRLGFRVQVSRGGDTIKDFMYRDVDWREKHDVLAGVLAHRAAGRVEELRVAAVDKADGGEPMYFETSEYELSASRSGLGFFKLGLGALPSNTLRALELTNCSGLVLPPRRPRRREQRRRRPVLPPSAGIPPAAPLRRAAGNRPAHHRRRAGARRRPPRVRLLEEETDRVSPRSWYGHSRAPRQPPLDEGDVRTLRCWAATSLVLDRCCLKERGRLEIYAPALRRFRYKGVLRIVSLSPPPPELARAELILIDYGYLRRKDQRDARRSFWRVLAGFVHAKEMKLAVRDLEDMAVASEALRVRILPAFRRLERLELEGVHRPTGKTAAAAIANLLRCSPKLREFRVKLTTAHCDAKRESGYGRDYLKRKHRSDFQDSVDRFERHRSQPAAAEAGDDEDDGAAEYDEVSDDLPGLSGRSFECLQSSLRRVGLQFRREKKDEHCLGIRLIKFFAENAMVLEEMCVDGGTEKMCEHLNPKVQTWIAAGSSKLRKMDLHGAGAGVAVLPLPRRD